MEKLSHEEYCGVLIVTSPTIFITQVPKGKNDGLHDMYWPRYALIFSFAIV